MIGAMSMLAPIDLSDRDKLDALRRLDQFRKWRSLDEKRYCLCCGNLITGHHIQIVGGTRGTGPLRAICSMDGCNSIPMDWVLPTDEVLAKNSMRINEFINPATRSRSDGRERPMSTSLRWLAHQFKRSA